MNSGLVQRTTVAVHRVARYSIILRETCRLRDIAAPNDVDIESDSS